MVLQLERDLADSTQLPSTMESVWQHLQLPSHKIADVSAKIIIMLSLVQEKKQEEEPRAEEGNQTTTTTQRDKMALGPETQQKQREYPQAYFAPSNQ